MPACLAPVILQAMAKLKDMEAVMNAFFAERASAKAGEGLEVLPGVVELLKALQVQHESLRFVCIKRVSSKNLRMLCCVYECFSRRAWWSSSRCCRCCLCQFALLVPRGLIETPPWALLCVQLPGVV